MVIPTRTTTSHPQCLNCCVALLTFVNRTSTCLTAENKLIFLRCKWNGAANHLVAVPMQTGTGTGSRPGQSSTACASHQHHITSHQPSQQSGGEVCYTQLNTCFDHTPIVRSIYRVTIEPMKVCARPGPDSSLATCSQLCNHDEGDVTRLSNHVVWSYCAENLFPSLLSVNSKTVCRRTTGPPKLKMIDGHTLVNQITVSVTSIDCVDTL